MKEDIGIYCIENIINNKKYIGQSIHIKERWKRHISELEHNTHYNDYLQRSWNKYSKDNFRFYILENCTEDNLDNREIYWINYYNTTDSSVGYNLKSGGQNSGTVLSNYSKEKLRKSVTESYCNSNLREIRSLNALSQWSNPEIKKKIIGKNNGMYGKHHSEESKRKMSEHKKGSISWRRNTTPVICIETNIKYNDATDAGQKLKLDSSAILKVCRNERKTCGGYHWKFT